jgi:EAL domain-containing protein (putative c-di-GMP-specific phosphodiesterase class I)
MGCRECLGGAGLHFDFSMAFQPIVSLSRREVFAYEALARGPAGEPASEVFQHVDESTRYRFDQACRVKAIELASRLEVPTYLSINLGFSRDTRKNAPQNSNNSFGAMT